MTIAVQKLWNSGTNSPEERERNLHALTILLGSRTLFGDILRTLLYYARHPGPAREQDLELLLMISVAETRAGKL